MKTKKHYQSQSGPRSNIKYKYIFLLILFCITIIVQVFITGKLTGTATNIEKIFVPGNTSATLATSIQNVDPALLKSIKRMHHNEFMQKTMRNYRLHRPMLYDSWFDDDNQLRVNADAVGPILDFAIVGFPKCGTTTLVANLGRIAPMPPRDACQSLEETVHDAYKVWPKQYPVDTIRGDEPEKLYRGTKCPRFHDYMDKFNTRLQKTKLIFGIRHPVKWFQSAWLMEASFFPAKYRQMSPYDLTKGCENLENPRMCMVHHCPAPHIFCVKRARFHIDLAMMGKTAMNTTEEFSLLAPDDFDGGDMVTNLNVRNKIFLYEQTQLKHDNAWSELGEFLDYPNGTIQHKIYKKSRPKHVNDTELFDICDPHYDRLRQQLMPYAYQLSKWTCDYLVPVALDETRDDVVVADPDHFCKIVKGYEEDPCGRLMRQPEDGKYVLKPDLPSVASTIGTAGQGESTNQNEEERDEQSEFSENIVDDDENVVALALNNTDTTGMTDFEQYMLKRGVSHKLFNSWFENGDGTGKLKPQADVDGPVLDFALIGFSRTGTSTVFANLGQYVAPIPDDVQRLCQPLQRIVHKAYRVWPTNIDDNEQKKLFRGTKCIGYHSILPILNFYLPRTKLICGIRHPVLWFQSAWLAEASFFPEKYKTISPYNLTRSCEGLDDSKHACSVHCPREDKFCVHRSRFHLSLAAMGKTLMSTAERKLLAPHDFDGGNQAQNFHIQNKIFIYEVTQLSEDQMWTDLGAFLGYRNNDNSTMIPHDDSNYRAARPIYNTNDASSPEIPNIDICKGEYDELRKVLMAYAYEMSQWFIDYLVPIAMDDKRDDVVIADHTKFVSIVKHYQNDPCRRLVRDNDSGQYVVQVNDEISESLFNE